MSTTQFWPFGLQQFSNNGVPLAGGFVSSYQAGTTTPLATYTDNSGTTPNTNPVVLDGNGRAQIWMSSSAYKFVIQDSSNNVIATIDNVSYLNAASIVGSMLNSNVAGVALAQNSTTKALDVQVDNSTIDVNGSNKLEVKAGSIGITQLNSSGTTSVLIRRARDWGFTTTKSAIPQYPWADPTFLLSGIPTPASVNCMKFSPDGEFLAIGLSASPYIAIYQRNGATFSLLANPGQLPGGVVLALDWSPQGNYLACAFDGYPSELFGLYRRFGNKFISLGYGPWTHSGASASQGIAISFSPNGDFLMGSGSYTAKGTYIYRPTLSSSSLGGTLSYSGTAASIPILNTGDGTVSALATDFNSNVQPVINTNSGQLNSNFTTVENFVPLIDLIPSLTDITGSLSFSGSPIWGPNSTLLDWAAPTASSFYTRIDETWTAGTGPDVSAYAADLILTPAFSPNGKYVAFGLTVSPYILVFSFDGTNFTQLPNPSVLPGGGCYSNPTWSADSSYLMIGQYASPYFVMYAVSGTTLTKVANPQTLPGSGAQYCSFSPDRQFLALGLNASPYVNIYQTTGALSAGSLLTLGGIIDV